MKRTVLLLITGLNLLALNAQKLSYEYDSFINLTGTEYSIAKVQTYSKMEETQTNLLFINTKTGEAKEINFPEGTNLREIKQVRIDSLNINILLLVAGTIDWNGKKGIDWSDPKQIFILSPSGKEMIQLTENNYFTLAWTVNEYTGTLIVSGYFDGNKNNKRDKIEANEILLYDLRTLELKKKL
jgi:hypothetical protein